MRIRHILATAAVGAALSAGVAAAPAHASATDAHVTTSAAAMAVPATTDQTKGEVVPQSAYYFWASYTSLADCTVAGYDVIQSNPSRYLKAKCVYGSNKLYNLYILI